MDLSERGTILCDANGVDNLTNFKKGRHKGKKDLLNWDLKILFFISAKLRQLRFTQNDTPKMVKNVRFY